MTPRFEKAVELIRALPELERKKLRELLEKMKKLSLKPKPMTKNFGLR